MRYTERDNDIGAIDRMIDGFSGTHRERCSKCRLFICWEQAAISNERCGYDLCHDCLSKMEEEE